MRAVVTVELVLFVVAAAVFIVRYLWVPGWWRSPAGRHMMTFTATFGVFVGMLLAAWFRVRFPLTVWAVVLGALDVMLCGQVWLLLRLQRRRADDHASRPAGNREA